jgi:hypothetical protein
MVEQLGISLADVSIVQLKSKTIQLIHQAYGDEAMRPAAVCKWWKCFRDREMNMKGQNHLFHYPPEACSSLQHIFGKLVQRCKKCIACQGRYFEKETVTTLPQSSNLE